MASLISQTEAPKVEAPKIEVPDMPKVDMPDIKVVVVDCLDFKRSVDSSSLTRSLTYNATRTRTRSPPHLLDRTLTRAPLLADCPKSEDARYAGYQGMRIS